MKRKIYLQVEFDWEDYDDVSDELILEDSGIMDGIKDGVQVKLFAIPDVSQQRELLVAFADFVKENMNTDFIPSRIIDAFLSNQ